jgi:hypothetical protein
MKKIKKKTETNLNSSRGIEIVRNKYITTSNKRRVKKMKSLKNCLEGVIKMKKSNIYCCVCGRKEISISEGRYIDGSWARDTMIPKKYKNK